MDLYQKIAAGVLRAALAPVLVWLTSHGIISESETTQVVVALAGVLDGKILVQNHCYRADEMAIVLDMGKEFGYKVSTFHHAVEAYKIGDLLAAAGTCSAVWADWWGFKMEAYDAIPENAGDFRWLDRKVVNALKNLPERNRFMKGLYAWVGFKSVAIPFEPKNRESGKSTFSMGRLIKLGMAGLTSFSAAPLQLWIGIGALISFLALVYGAYVIVDTAVYGNAVSGWPTLTVALMLFSGIQLLSIGILGEYIGRIFTEVKQRPLYVIAEDLSESK